MGNASKRALYPGTFDPVTLGHLDLIRRGCDLFGRLAVAVAENASKDPVFTAEERIEMLRAETRGLPVEVDSFRGLVVDYCRPRGARARCLTRQLPRRRSITLRSTSQVRRCATQEPGSQLTPSPRQPADGARGSGHGCKRQDSCLPHPRKGLAL